MSVKQWRHINNALGFGGPVPMVFLGGSLKTRPFQLTKDLYYITRDGVELKVNAGYRTDFASIPWFFRRIFSPVGDHGHADFIHDWLCDVNPKICSHIEAANIFNEAMEFLKVNPIKRKLMVAGVKICGPRFKKGEK